MNKKNLKNFIKSINLFEIIWLSSTIITLIIFSILFPDIVFEDKTNLLVVICSIITILCSPIVEVLISKQCRWWTIFSIFFVELTDIVVLVSLGVYTSALISLLFWIPVDIITFIRWGKHKDEQRRELTKVKTFGIWKNILIAVVMCVVGFLLGLILKDLPNSEISYVVAFSNVFEICNGLFLITRHDEQWLAWFGYLICETIMWISLGHYIMLITVLSMMINTVYGMIKWRLYIKNKQKKNLKADS
jgi:nicotinamide mononucleotide transporter